VRRGDLVVHPREPGRTVRVIRTERRDDYMPGAVRIVGREQSGHLDFISWIVDATGTQRGASSSGPIGSSFECQQQDGLEE
jgi:hypothetical protein